VPQGAQARILWEDARDALPRARRKFGMLFTSPPYYDVTNYSVDNWIRLWMLGEGALPDYSNAQRYGDRKRYADMLRGVFSLAKTKLETDAVIYVRTDSREFTRATTHTILSEIWSEYGLHMRQDKPSLSQTRLFGDKAEKPGETDFLLLPTKRRGLAGFRQVH
jgi:hypothetical protein